MAQSYADAVKNTAKERDTTEDIENIEADLIVNNDNKQVRINGHQSSPIDSNEDKSSENYDATLSRSVVESDTTRSIDDNNKSRETSRKRGKSGKRKVSKKVIALGVAVDIAIAGLVANWIIKRPSVNRTHIGLGTIGLGLFFGTQWYVCVSCICICICPNMLFSRKILNFIPSLNII